MNSLGKTIVFVTLIVLNFIPRGGSVRCYVCNSRYDPSCGDPFFPVNVPLVNCDARLFAQFTRSYMCKKETKRIGDGTYHVVRDCAMQDFNQVEGQMCMTAPSGEFNCRCFGDACNRAIRRNDAASLLLPTLITFLVKITDKYFMH